MELTETQKGRPSEYAADTTDPIHSKHKESVEIWQPSREEQPALSMSEMT